MRRLPWPRPGAIPLRVARACGLPLASSHAPRPRSLASGSGGAPEDARRDGKAEFWDLVEKNTLLFNPRRLPNILVPAARLAQKDKDDPRLVSVLKRATKYLESDGLVVPPVLTPQGAASVIQAARQLNTPEARNFSLALLGALAAQVSQLEANMLARLSQELIRFRIRDAQLWRSVVDSTLKRPDLGPSEIVNLLDSLRRSVDFGAKPTAALQLLCLAATSRCQELNPRQIVLAAGSICRLARSHISQEAQLKALHILVDRWMASQPSDLSTSDSTQVVSLGVSLASIPGSVRNNLRTENYQAAASGWCERFGMHPGGALTAEESVVMLWVLKELSPVGLSRYRTLVELTLNRLNREAHYQGWSMLRLGQVLEILIASQYVYAPLAVDGTGQDEAIKDLILELEGRVAATVASQLSEVKAAPSLTKVVLRADQAGAAFWARCSGLANAVLERAAFLASDGAQRVAELSSLCDTIANSALAQTPEFRSGRRALASALAQRCDSQEPLLVTVLKKLEQEPEKEAPRKAAASWAPEAVQATSDAAKTAEVPKGSKFEELPVLSPTALAERLGKLSRRKANAAEAAMAAEALLGMLDSLQPADLLTCLSHVLSVGRRRLRQPFLLEVVERIGDQVALYAADFSTPQLVLALESFAEAGLQYHLVFESVLVELLRDGCSNGVSWGQAVSVLESFAAVRMHLPDLSHLYRRLRRQQELARMPTMGLIRFLSVSTSLELTDQAGMDVRELVSRILAETTPQRSLPLEEAAVITQSLLHSGTVLPDKQLRHILSWVASCRPSQLSQDQLSILRQYMLFILAQADEGPRRSLLRMPVEMQTFVSEILCNRSPNSITPSPEATRQFRSQVWEVAGQSASSLSLGPGGHLDLQIGETGWLLDGPEAFFRPFTQPLSYVPQEKRRRWLLEKLLSDDTARRSVANFFPGALDWPMLGGTRRLTWMEWQQTLPEARPGLLGCGLRPGGSPAPLPRVDSAGLASQL